MAKPSIPKGTRDFSPVEVSKRNYIFSIIKSNFEKYGYQPIETPSFENSETLMGKYGEEGDRLIFKILNSGDFFDVFNKSLLEIIKTILYNLQVFANSYPQNDNYFEFVDAVTSNAIDKAFTRNSISETIDYKNLRKELDLIIKNHFLDSLERLNQLKNSDNELLTLYSMTIYGIFISKSQSKYLSTPISEKALRYDLTVPFARYVVQHQHEIDFPFKRYQMQPVWRADRPQKGRFREFYQCDADVVGSTSLWQEVELVQLYDAVFSDLGLKGVTIKINNRKILSGIAEVIGAQDKLIDFTVALDKLDKIGEDGVKKEMIEKGISETAIEKVQPLFHFTGTIEEKIQKLSVLLSTSIEGMKGVEELQFICNNLTKLGLRESILDLDVTLARGLNYYTGAIFEVAPPKSVVMGSIGGGGRYDDLTGIFGLKDMSGVGISFGLDRIYLVLEELNLFPETVTTSTKALFINYGEKEAFYALQAIQKLRQDHIKVELYPDAIKVGKQFAYADKRQIQYAVIVGESEMLEGKFGLKNLQTGEQATLSFEDLKAQLS